MAETVTYTDIAKAAGVSRMTVSLALRNHPAVADKTAQRVRAAAEKLGYKPDPEINRLMSYLRTSRELRHDTVIAFIDPWPRDPAIADRFHMDRLYEGAQRRGEELGFKVSMFWLKEPGMSQRRMNSILYARGIRGLLIPPLPKGRGHLTLQWQNFSCVSMDDGMKPDLHRVTANQLHNAMTAFRRLRKLGYERIGFIETRFLDEKVNHAHSAAFHWHNAQQKAANRVPPLIEEKVTPESVARYVAKHRPDAVVSMLAESVFAKLGIKVPGDLALASLYNVRQDGSLAGIAPQAEAVGAAAVDLLSGLVMRNETGVPERFKNVMVAGVWVDGATAPARTEGNVAGMAAKGTRKPAKAVRTGKGTKAKSSSNGRRGK